MIIMKKALPGGRFWRACGVTRSAAVAMMAPGRRRWRPGRSPTGTPTRLRVSCRWGRPCTAGCRRDDTLDVLSPIAEPLGARQRSGDSHFQSRALQIAYPGTHATSNSSFLSAAFAKHTESTDYFLGTTVDQIAAREDRRRHAVAVARNVDGSVVDGRGQCDNGYACVYQNCLSWSSPTTPLPAEAHPRLVFERLFGEGGRRLRPPPKLRARASLLDSCTEDIARLRRRSVPVTACASVSIWTAVREVERRIQRAEADVGQSGARPGSAGGCAGGVRRPRPTHVRPPGSRASGRYYAGHHVPAGARTK